MTQKLKYERYITPENEAETLPHFKEFILENKQHPDILKAIGETAGFALFADALQTLALISELGYDLNTIKDIDGCLLLHFAAALGLNDALTLFKKLGVNLEVKNWQGLTPLYVAMHACKHDTVEHLLNLGCKVDPLFPLIKKIDEEALEALLEDLDTEVVNIRELLLSKGFAPNLDYYLIELEKTKFTFVDFSGMSLVHANISAGGREIKFSFENANLENATVGSSLLKSDNVNFKGANLNGASGIVEEGFYQSLLPAKTNFVPILESNYFSQEHLIRAFDLKEALSPDEESFGDCRGLVFEYARYILNSKSKGASGDLDKNFIDKLYRKLGEERGNAVDRIHTYQGTLQDSKSVKSEYIELNLESYPKFLQSLHSLDKAEFVELVIGDAHTTAIRAVEGQGYIFFDPNYGIFKYSNSQDLYNELLLKLPFLYQALVEGGEHHGLTVRDLGKRVFELGLINAENKDAKNIHKLYAALKAGDIKTIETLAKVQKIDAVGCTFSFHQAYNILKFAIYQSSEESLIALISNNTKLDLHSKANVVFIISHLILTGKLSKPVLDTLSHKALELGALEGKAIIDSAYNLQCNLEEKHITVTTEDNTLIECLTECLTVENNLTLRPDCSELHITINWLPEHFDLM